MTKNTYRIRNWKEYNTALIQRGSITLWFSEDALQMWHKPDSNSRCGRPRVYSDEAILCALMVKTVYHLPLRASVGFLRSMVSVMKLLISIPSYSQISRRARELGKKLTKFSHKRPTDIVFDSTGLKVFGEGEWKVRKHGASKRRTWRKLHIGIDPRGGEIIVGKLTENGTGCGDGEVGKKMISQLPKTVKRVFGDGGYDGIEFRQSIENLGADPIIPPPKGAVVHRDRIDRAMKKRNNAVLEIKGLGGDEEGRSLWKLLKGYHKRSLAETTMYRIKQITGGKLSSKIMSMQCVEASVKCLVINKMTRLGMPKGIWQSIT